MHQPADTHRADGLFFLSEPLLRKRGACLSHRKLWVKEHGPDPVPVTHARLAAHFSQSLPLGAGSASRWLAERMVRRGLITVAEHLRICYEGDDWLDPTGTAGIVMDVLAARAQREGLL